MASKMTTLVACALVVLFASYGTEGKAIVGMNWGRQSAQRLLPSQVVDLLLQNEIGNARVYTSQPDILEAFTGSGINLTVGIYNILEIKSMDVARAWVKKRNKYIIPSNIRSIYFGGYIFGNTSTNSYIASSLKSLRWMQAALNETQSGHQVTVNFVHAENALKPKILNPSDAEFRDEFKEQMIEFLEFLKENNAPFVIQLNPVQDALDVVINDITFGFPDGKSKTVITDTNGFVYTNVIQWRIDSFLWALSKLNFTHTKILIGQIGWPTDGFLEANVMNAERFWKLLLPWLTGNKGTPLRPGVPIDFFAHALTDETQMVVPFTRHWGIFGSNGMPKFKIDLTGQDRDMYPVRARGIMQMPHRWCVFNGDRRDPAKVNRLYDWACDRTDCSSALSRGGSCSAIDFVKNVSFAFNMYFQFQFQEESACDFEGLAALSDKDPSSGDCVFPVEVVKGRQDNYVPTYLIVMNSNGDRVRSRLNNIPALFVFVMLFFR